MRIFIIAAALASAMAGTAGADDFDFGYTTFSGVVVKGVVSATNYTGFYSVDNITGTRGNESITGYDFFDDTPQSFQYSNGYVSDVDFSYYVGGDNYEVRFPGNGYGSEFLNASSVDLVTGFSLSPVTAQVAAVPEPYTWAMMILGFGIAGVGMRRRVRRSEVKLDTRTLRINESVTV